LRAWKYIILVISVSLLLLLSFLTGYVAHGWLTERSLQQPSTTEEQFAIFWEAWNIAQQHFVDPSVLDTKEMTYGAIRGMLDSLGDIGHTRFMSPEELEAEMEGARGEYSGIGAQISMRDGRPIIVSPFDDSPAQEAGIQPGDYVMQVDGEDTSGLSLDEVVAKIKGPEGTSVTLTLLRPGHSALIEVTVVRQAIRVDAASWAMVPETNIAYIRISQFSDNALPDVEAALTEAKDSGAQALIVDVRSNPGGLLDQAVAVTSQFLESGNVVLEQSREGTEKEYPVKPGGLAVDIPLVVLVNEGSASASEIFAGAIQDHERGPIIGQTTFGTGTILSTYYLRDGSAILLGTGQWLTPSGKSLRNQGITPDIEVALPLDGQILTPKQVADMSPEEIEQAGDTQLLRGIQFLQESISEPGQTLYLLPAETPLPN